MPGGMLPQCANMATEMWSCLSVPPRTFHAERTQRKVPPDREQAGPQRVSCIRLSNPPKKGMFVDLNEMC